jgi:hypothetical protein
VDGAGGVIVGEGHRRGPAAVDVVEAERVFAGRQQVVESQAVHRRIDDPIRMIVKLKHSDAGDRGYSGDADECAGEQGRQRGTRDH